MKDSSSLSKEYAGGEDAEKESLLKNATHTVTYSRDVAEDVSISFTRRNSSDINLKSASLIFVSFSCGAAILVLPYTIVQLGLVSWFFFVSFIITLLMFCAYLMNESTLHMLQTCKRDSAIRDPYPAVAELAGGRILRMATIAVMYTTNLSACISWVLLSATVLRDLVPFKHVSYLNQIRLWTVIIITFLTPLMYLGTYSDLKVPALLAISSSSISAMSIIGNSWIAKYQFNISSDIILPQGDPVGTPSVELLFLAFGSICFSASGASYSIPNITVLTSIPEKLPISIIGSLIFIFIVYILSGIIPYMVFGNNSLPSITTTFYCVMEKHEMNLSFKVLTVTAQVFMTFHFMMVCLLTLNPCYQHIEELFNIPQQIGWKRIVARTSLMLFVLTMCSCLPRFAPVLSIAGGVPFTLIGIIFPIVIYIILFQLNICKNIIFVVVLIVTVILIVGNFLSSLLNLFNASS